MTRAALFASAAFVASLFASATAASQEVVLAANDLSRLSIEQLAELEVTSVSKRPETIAHAPAAIYVLTNDDIRRAGVQTLPEALQLAPNLEVMRDQLSGAVRRLADGLATWVPRMGSPSGVYRIQADFKMAGRGAYNHPAKIPGET